MDISTIKPGDVVGVASPKWPGRWTVEKINQATLLLTQEGRGRLKCHKQMVVDAPPEGETGMQALQRQIAARPAGLRTAALVRTRRQMRDNDPDQLWVVIKDGVETVNIAALGGHDRGQYWRVSPRDLIVIDPKHITIQEGE